ncbi:hypothetical protein EX30DRAFT_345079 [Ascodesmis nigricans]|uniref:Uncharacterized protein n=1 Tax=Ascodesmis nigricans TaxID=341454 RepID=A0A4S2MHJ4_9PEZI|nr:hypothetical protein EX30DRAFT_345079 [Ascodesmis nigricans]
MAKGKKARKKLAVSKKKKAHTKEPSHTDLPLPDKSLPNPLPSDLPRPDNLRVDGTWISLTSDYAQLGDPGPSKPPRPKKEHKKRNPQPSLHDPWTALGLHLTPSDSQAYDARKKLNAYARHLSEARILMEETLKDEGPERQNRPLVRPRSVLDGWRALHDPIRALPWNSVLLVTSEHSMLRTLAGHLFKIYNSSKDDRRRTRIGGRRINILLTTTHAVALLLDYNDGPTSVEAILVRSYIILSARLPTDVREAILHTKPQDRFTEEFREKILKGVDKLLERAEEMVEEEELETPKLRTCSRVLPNAEQGMEPAENAESPGADLDVSTTWLETHFEPEKSMETDNAGPKPIPHPESKVLPRVDQSMKQAQSSDPEFCMSNTASEGFFKSKQCQESAESSDSELNTSVPGPEGLPEVEEGMDPEPEEEETPDEYLAQMMNELQINTTLVLAALQEAEHGVKKIKQWKKVSTMTRAAQDLGNMLVNMAEYRLGLLENKKDARAASPSSAQAIATASGLTTDSSSSQLKVPVVALEWKRLGIVLIRLVLTGPQEEGDKVNVRIQLDQKALVHYLTEMEAAEKDTE